MIRTMKFRCILAIVAGLALSGSAVWADPPAQVGRLDLINGSVSFHPGSVDEWAPATLNYPLTAGDHLWTADGSRAEVHVRSAAIRLGPNTEFSFLNLDDQTVQVRVSEGSLNVGLRNVDDGTTFEIDTPNATVTLPSAGSYRIDVQPSGETSVTVRAGRAEVTAGQDAYDVTSGQSTVVSGTDSIVYSVGTASQPDEWDSWSAVRDRREDQAASDPYISRDMIGSEDLYDNGTWYNDATGPAWAPSNVPAGWAPYRFGHWGWVSPWGWTWVDDSSWGFAPFHYGRWAYQNARWQWSPGALQARPVYAPALVVFVGGSGWAPLAGEGIGWFPLGPREAYIPPYQVSADYERRINVAHITNFDAQAVDRTHPDQIVYVNRTAPRGVTFVPREVFAQSRPAGGAFLAVTAAEITRAPFMGMNAKIVPQRESIIARPVGAKAPPPQPPPAMLTRRVYSSVAPAPAQVPFEQQQKALAASPGRPVDPQAISLLQASQKPAPAQVTMVKRATLTKQVPPVLKTSPQAVAPTRQQPVVKPNPESPQAATRPIPVVQPQRPVTPVPAVKQQVMKPAPAIQQKPLAPAVAAPQPVVRPVPVAQPRRPVTPVPAVKQQAMKPAPAIQQKPPAPAVAAPRPVVKPVPAAQPQRPVTPVPAVRQQAVKPAPAMQRAPAAPPAQNPATRAAPGNQKPAATPARGNQKDPLIWPPTGSGQQQ